VYEGIVQSHQPIPPHKTKPLLYNQGKQLVINIIDINEVNDFGGDGVDSS
jgi:hypothetical protein